MIFIRHVSVYWKYIPLPVHDARQKKRRYGHNRRLRQTYSKGGKKALSNNDNFP